MEEAESVSPIAIIDRVISIDSDAAAEVFQQLEEQTEVF